MSEKFEGKVLRAELDGFTVVKFNTPIGPSANTHGLFTSSTATTIVVPISELKEGDLVTGTAEPKGAGGIASITTITASTRKR